MLSHSAAFSQWNDLSEQSYSCLTAAPAEKSTCTFQRLYAAGLSSTISKTAAQDQAAATAAASQAAASTAAAIKAEPSGPAAFVKQEIATATQPSVKHDTTDPIAQASQAQPDNGFSQTQLYGAARQTGSTQMQGDEATQPYEAVPQFDPWNALEIMWDSDTPPGWPKLICPWQVTPLAFSQGSHRTMHHDSSNMLLQFAALSPYPLSATFLH